MLMHLAAEDELISKPAQAEIKAALARKPNATVYSYPGQHHAFARHNGTHYNAAAAAPIAFASRQDGIFAELKSAVGNELSKAGLMLFTQLDQGGCA